MQFSSFINLNNSALSWEKLTISNKLGADVDSDVEFHKAEKQRV